ncbi:unnamed protein product [Larinioides sclopetarius]|uniref:Uncharacterized protein n=1 Tax=Larinioides sclopetarius TaxID=280406 RepID=A0AAV1Z3K2_9ARAC
MSTGKTTTRSFSQACHLYGISLERKRLKNAIFAVAALQFKNPRDRISRRVGLGYHEKGSRTFQKIFHVTFLLYC